MINIGECIEDMRLCYHSKRLEDIAIPHSEQKSRMDGSTWWTTIWLGTKFVDLYPSTRHMIKDIIKDLTK